MKAKPVVLSLAIAGLAVATCDAGPLQKARSTQVALSTVEQGNLCGGTAIGSHTILTAEHCVVFAEGEIFVDGQKAGLKVIAKDGNDHVFLSTTLTLKNIAKMGPPPQPADRVYLWGRPHGVEKILYREGYYAGDVIDPMGKTWQVYDLEIINGDSGSGIFDSKGRLIATLSIILSQDARWRMAGTLGLQFTQEQMELIK